MTTSARNSGPRPATADDIEAILVANTGADASVFAGSANTPLAQLGMDSLAALELEATVLDRFGVHIPDEPLAMSISDLVSFINARSGGE